MPDGPSTLLFQHPSRAVRRRDLRLFFADLVERVAKGREVTCLVTSDTELRRMNREFRGKDYATDVLSFPAEGRSLTGRGSVATRNHERQRVANGTLGEIAISYERAAEQAAELGHSVDEELRILMLHGVLHLTGLDHETDAGEMARVETRWRKRFGLPAGLIERSTAAKNGR